MSGATPASHKLRRGFFWGFGMTEFYYFAAFCVGLGLAFALFGWVRP